MTNYNERLDEIMSKLARDTTLADRAADIATTPSAVNDASKRYQWSLGEAKQALTSLIKELVAEARIDENEAWYALGRMIDPREFVAEIGRLELKKQEEV